MRAVATSLVALGLMAAPVMADVTLTRMPGTLGNPFSSGGANGFGWSIPGGDGGGFELGNLYDNVLTVNGGAATGGFFEPFLDIPGEQAYLDWGGTQAQWGDDLHGISAGTGHPAVVTSINYGYLNLLGTTTHIIKIYDMLTPSTTPTVTTLVTKGALLASVVLPDLPSGAFIVKVSNLAIGGVGSSAWIKFEETGRGFPGTFWLSGGGGNGVGRSNPGVVYSSRYPDGTTQNLWVPFPYFYNPLWGRLASNIQVALSGFHVPAPAVMSLLGVAGLVTLRRRGRT